MMTPFDPEVALDTMADVTRWNDEEGRLTMYAVVCPEHGGLVCSTAPEAIKAATTANAHGTGCVYLPLALTLDPHYMPNFPTLEGDEDA